MKKAKVLFYDIETTPLKAYIWGLGKQVVRHPQLDVNHDKYGIICVTYCWDDGKPARVIGWGYSAQNTKKVISAFDKLITKADVVIGKNSDRFDNKMVNALRMLYNLPSAGDWSKYSDDLEKQMRKHFRLPSQSLDYISAQLGLGGKRKMEFEDWINILEKTKEGPAAYKKMLEYGKKDVEDTRKIWNYCKAYIEPKFNYASFRSSRDHMCQVCGSVNVVKNGTRVSGKTLYQRYHCNDHGGAAFRTPTKKVRG